MYIRTSSSLHASYCFIEYCAICVCLRTDLSWTDHVDYIKNKVSQRLGVLQRIKHLLPRDTRELFVKAMVLPILDYADVT